MHEARQKFCLDLFSMFHKTGSCSTLYFCLVMQITVQHFVSMKGSSVSNLRGKKNILNYYTQVNMGTKKLNKLLNLFFSLLKQHTDHQLLSVPTAMAPSVRVQ